MTVPKCKGRVVRDSKAYRYNETGLNQRALQKIWATGAKRERRLAKRTRRQSRGETKRRFASTEEADRARGYRRVTTQVPWISNEEAARADREQHQKATMGLGFLNPVTGEARWGPRESKDESVTLRTTTPIYRPEPHQVHRWVSVAETATGVKPVSQKMGQPEIAPPKKSF